MKKTTKAHFVLFAALAVLLGSLAACGAPKTDATGSEPDTANASSADGSSAFSYSQGIDDNGFWQGVNAADYVTLYDYSAFPIPKDVHEISDSDVQAEIDAMLESYAETKQITDRAVVDRDTVNIDYVGSVDGVEFDGGSTGGAGTEITIGVTSYIDDFLEQLIGHRPGETFDINVTFPDDYGVDNLNGKDAVFVTTVNYIAEKSEPKLDDAFVAANLSGEYGYTTVADMRKGVSEDLQKRAIQNYIYEYLSTDVAVSSVPESLIEHQKGAMLQYYRDMAESYGVSLDEFVTSYAGAASTDELVESNTDNFRQAAQSSLVVQAIAQDAKISVTLDDVASYFENNMGSPDYSQYEESYGLPYLKQSVLSQKVMDYLTEHTVLA